MKDLYLKLLRLLPYITVFIGSFYNPIDSDLGWYLKYGQYFFQHHQILRDNLFSAMMPHYLWVNHSWATDLLSYGVFSRFGFLGLNLLAAIIITFTFYFFSKAAKLTLWGETLLFPILLYFESPLNAVSFRAQLISFLFLGMLFYILSNNEQKITNKIFWAVPLFLLWANFHGEFVLGLVVLGIWCGLYVIVKLRDAGKNKIRALLPLTKLLGILFLVILLVVLINPFGVGVYIETLRHFFNPWSKYISEWLPFEEMSDVWWRHIVMGTFILIGFISLFFTGKLKQKIPYLGIILILFVLSFIMRRYAWPLYYMSLPLIAPLADLVKPPSKKAQTLVLALILPILLIGVILIKSPFDKYISMSWDKYCDNYRHCSFKATRFLMQNKLESSRLFTTYDWGGWLIWNFPQIKPTIDGRMVFWQDDKGYRAFAEYYPIEQNWAGHEIEKTKYDVVFMSPSKTIYQHMLDLVNTRKWRLAYQDRYAGIFVRIK